jgi:hygromycin-B 4-O-kinase
MFDEEDIVSICKDSGFYPADELNQLSKGWWSQAYSFRYEGKDWVLRINGSDKDFRKDQKAWDFLHDIILVPEIKLIGKFKDDFFAITEKCSGITLIDEHVTSREIVFNLFDILLQMRTFNANGLNGWGLMNESFEGNYNSWEDWLLSFHNHKMDYTLQQLVNDGLLESMLHKVALNRIKQLLPFCKTEKYLVHGDAGFDNVLCGGKKITGVIDWGEAALGDFLYDIAYLFFNTESVDYKGYWQEFVQQRQLQIPFMEERLRCYQMVIGLNSVAIAAYTGNEKIYQLDRNKLMQLL